MRFVKGDEVYSAQGEKIGTLSRVVIDAKTRDVTDLVVERGVLARNEKVIPIGLIDVENEERLMLREANQRIDDLLDYETIHYIPVDRVDAPYENYENIETSYWYPPANLQIETRDVLPPDLPSHVERTEKTVPERKETSIPEGRIAIAQGARVVSADDKHIGNVEQVITEPGSNNVTHFVIGKGFLLKEHKLVPSIWVAEADGEQIRLSVEAKLFDRLPNYQPDS